MYNDWMQPSHLHKLSAKEAFFGFPGLQNKMATFCSPVGVSMGLVKNACACELSDSNWVGVLI